MRSRTFVIVLILIFCGTCHGQNFNPQKDLAFGQIAAGGGYESVLTVTNRGTGAYSGTLELYTGAGLSWNPTINGAPLISGRLDITLNPGETRTYRITLTGGTESAFGFIRSAGMEQTSLIEGNLTYFVSSASAKGPESSKNERSFSESNSMAFEAVGVPPSTEFYKTTVPFEDFSTVALALGNVNLGPSANVKLTVFSDSNQQLGTQSTLLVPHGL